jgi:hypothetical protein
MSTIFFMTYEIVRYKYHDPIRFKVIPAITG